MKRRIFIAINLPEEVKKELQLYQSKWPELPVRWTKLGNVHITLVFIADVGDKDVTEVSRIVKEVALHHSPFPVHLTKICYGPPDKMPPRMIWAVGDRSQEFTLLRDAIEKSLLVSPRIHFPQAKREFTPHITLGRMRLWEWQQIEPEELPEVTEELDIAWQVKSVELMESKLKRGGAEYTIVESVSLS